jgi:ABC-type transport system substrate-binding protein
MHLKQPDAGLLSKLAVGWAIIFPSELPWDALKETVIGTGPFIWKEYVTGAGSTTVRNPDYFRQGYPCLDGVRNYVFKDPTVALASLRARQLDINSYMQYIYPADAKLLQEKHPEIIVSLPPRLWWHSIAGKIGEAPWNDRRVRQAFSLAVDRYKAVEVLGEGAGAVGGFMPPWTQWSLPKEELATLLGTPDPVQMQTRREQAKKLLAEAGYKPGDLKLRWMILDTPESVLTPQFVQEQLRQIGVEITLEVTDRGTFTQRRDAKDFQLITMDNTSGTLDPSLFYADFFLCGASSNEIGYCNQEFDALYQQQLSERNEAKRIAIVHQMERILTTDWPAVQVRWVAEGMAWWPWVKNWEDVDPAYYNNVTLEEVWLDDPGKY